MRRPPLQLLAIFGGFLLLAVLHTWPQAALVGRGFVGGPIAQSDGWQNVWNLWWVRRALSAGQNPFFTTLLYAPQGVSLALHTLALSNALVALPVLFAAGPLAGYGVALLLNTALSGFCVFLLARRIIGATIPALVAGVLAALAPAHAARWMEGQHHGALQWAALYLLALLALLARPDHRRALLLGLAAALLVYNSLYQTLFVALMTLVYLAAVRRARPTLRALLGPLLLAELTAAALLLPLLVNLPAALNDNRRGAEHWQAQSAQYSADLLDLLLPSAYHPLWGPAVGAYQARLHPDAIGWVVAPGYLFLALIVLGCVTNWRQARPWALTGGALLVFALGPTLQLGGWQTRLPLPYWLIGALPGVGFGRRPALAVVVALVPLALVAGMGAQTLLSRVGRRWTAPLLAALTLVWLAESWVAPEILTPEVAPVYASLRGQPGVLLELPLNPGEVQHKSAALQAQMIHGRPIMGGYVARPPDYPLARGAPLVGQIAGQECEPAGIVAESPALTLAALRGYGVTQLTLNSTRGSPARIGCAQRLIATLGLRPSQVDGPLAVYDLPDAPPAPFLFLGDGWLRLEEQGRRRWRWMGASADLYLVNPSDQPQRFQLRIRAQSLGVPRPLTIALNGRALGALSVTPTISRVYSLWLTAAPGQNHIQLSAPTATEPDLATLRELSISVEQVWITP